MGCPVIAVPLRKGRGNCGLKSRAIHMNNIIDFEDLIGKSLEELEGASINYRVSSYNGVDRILSCEYNDTRLNIDVVNGVVTEVWFG